MIALLGVAAACAPAAAAATRTGPSGGATTPNSPSTTTPAGVPKPGASGGAAPSTDAAIVALAPTPPMGWNPWYKFGCGINEQLVEQTARAMVASGMAADGYRYVNLDDCWMAHTRDSNGNLQANPQTFPSGIAALATYVHGLGLKLGIYLDAGTRTCAGLPGSSSHYAQDAATMASWGVDFIKLDYCYTQMMPAQPIYAAMHQAILSAPRPMVLSVCDNGFDQPWQWGAPIANMWRTAHDYTAFGAQTGHWWTAVMTVLDKNADLYKFARPGAWNDPDMLLAGTGVLSTRQERSQFSLWSMMAAPLLVDGDVRALSPVTASIVTNRDVIAVDQDPAGLQGERILGGTHQVWIRKLADGSLALLLFNAGRRSATLKVSASSLGLPRRYRVRDLWWHRSWVSSAATIRARIKPYDVAMLRLQPA